MAKREIFFAVVVGILLVVNIINYFQIEGLRDNISTLETEIMGINSSVDEISWQVESGMAEFVHEQTWLRMEDYEVIKTDFENHTIEVKLEWALRERSSGEEVLFLYRELGQEEWIEVKVEQGQGLHYSLVHTFSFTGNYETQIIAVSDSGQRGEKFHDLSFKDELENRILVHGFSYLETDKKVKVVVDIDNAMKHPFINEENQDDFRIKSAKAFLLSGKKQLVEIDLLKENENSNSIPEIETIRYEKTIKLDESVSPIELHVVIEDELGLRYEYKWEDASSY